jgi:hypothetical protein
MASILIGCGVARDASYFELRGRTYFVEGLANLKSRTSEDVVRRVGLPTDLLTDSDMQFMLYTNRSYTYWSAYGRGFTDSCLKVDIDRDNIVQDIEVKEWHRYKYHGDYQVKSPRDMCLSVFWSEAERGTLAQKTDYKETWYEIAEQRQRPTDYGQQPTDYASLMQEAEEGMADAQLALYKILVESEPRAALRWLCKSADQGNPEAMLRLATILEYGKDRLEKPSERIVKTDYVQAYVWFSLAVENDWYDNHSLNAFVNRRLDNNTLEDAKKELKGRKPGQCEEKIIFIQDIQ